MGVRLLESALAAPLRQLCINAGVEPATVTREVRGSKNVRTGYDLIKGEFCDMVKEGIVDAAKVLRVALENAVSVASVFLTSDTLVANAPKKDGAEEDDRGAEGEGMDEDY
jgi:chaperonin GroEL